MTRPGTTANVSKRRESNFQVTKQGTVYEVAYNQTLQRWVLEIHPTPDVTSYRHYFDDAETLEIAMQTVAPLDAWTYVKRQPVLHKLQPRIQAMIERMATGSTQIEVVEALIEQAYYRQHPDQLEAKS
jgi:hypothetical protein